MSEFIKCFYDSCNNITTKFDEEYGAYCYKHVSMVICKESKPIKEAKIKSPKRVKTKTKRPSSPSKYKPLQTIKCMLCEKKIDMVSKLDCGHAICESCLENIRTNKCPACGEILEGPLIKENIKKMISKKMYEDILNNEDSE